MPDRLVSGGRVVTGEAVYPADVLVRGERVAAVAAPKALDGVAAEVVDASGLLVLPGMVDVHVHTREPGYTHKEDITTCTRAAAAGGVTTIFGMPNVKPPTRTRAQLDEVLALYAAKSLVDYNHNPLPTALDEVGALAAAGVAAFKVYMVVDTGRDYPHPSGTGIHDHGHLLRMMERIAPTGLPFMVHPHDQAVMDTVEQEHWAVGDRGPAAYARTLATHDGLIWDGAIAVLLRMAKATGCRLHVVHTQTAGSIELIRQARAEGVDVTCETNHWTLFLGTWEDVTALGPYALSYWVPPHHQQAVWAALADGTIDLLASDHAPHLREEKDVGYQDMWAAHTGTPGIQDQYPLLLDAALARRITLERLAQVVAEAPARVFGLASKGGVRAGADADLVLADPRQPTAYRDETALSRCGWTPYRGRRTTGRIVRTLVRGRDVYRDGEVVGEPGWGRQAVPARIGLTTEIS